MTEIWIKSNYNDEWHQVDVLEDFNYSLNYSVSDISQPDKRKASFSKTIKLPATHNNNQLFTHIYEIGVYSNFNPNKKALCKVLSGGAEIFKGYARIISISFTNGVMIYEVNVVSDSGDFFASLGEKYLTDISFGFYVDRSYSTQIVSYTNTSASGTPVVFPLINNGRIDVTGLSPTINCDDVLPCTFAKTILDKIFSDAGYTYTSSFFTSTDFTDHFIIPSLPAYGEIPTKKIDVSFTFSIKNTSATPQPLWIDLNRVPVVSPSSIQTETIHLTITPGTATYTGTFTSLNIEYNDLIYFDTHFGVSCSILNGSTVVIADNDNGVTGGTNTVTVSNSVDFVPSGTIPFDTINSGSGNWDTGAYNLKGAEIEFSNYLPDQIKQKDFVMGLVKMFNLYIEVDKVNLNNLLIEPRNDFYASGTSVDWSDKLDLSKEIAILPMGLLDSNEYEFKHKTDGDFFNKQYESNFGYGYGRYLKSVDNDFVKNRNTVETIFSPTILRQATGTNLVLSTIVQDDPNLSSTNQDSNVVKGNIRLLYYDYINIDTWSLTDGASTNTGSSVPYAGHLDNPITPTKDYQFGTPDMVYFNIAAADYPISNLYSRYYHKMITEITDANSKLLTCSLYLTPHDVQKIDFRNTFYLMGQYFILNKLIDYNPNSTQSTKAEFLKLKTADAYTATIKKINIR